MRTRYFKFEFTNGDIKFFTAEEARDYCTKKNTDITFDGLLRYVANPPRIKDAWKPGYDPVLGREFRHRDERDRLVKERGLVEAGRSPGKPKEKRKSMVNDSMLKDFVDRGAEISGNEAIALKEGKLKPILD